MIKLNELIEMWDKDSEVDSFNLGAESLKTAKLHGKYLSHLSSSKLALRKAESNYFILRKKKYRYYRGEMSREELENENWEQWLGAKPLKTEMEEYLSTDQDLLSLLDKIEYYKTICYHLEQILKSLNSRTWDIKNTLEFMKLQAGN